MQIIEWLKHRLTKSRFMDDKAVSDFTRVAKDQELPLDHDRNERLKVLIESDDPASFEEIAHRLGRSSAGRFAIIDDGLGFQLVPWRPAPEKELGREVRGVMAPGGNVEWSIARKRGLGL